MWEISLRSPLAEDEWPLATRDTYAKAEAWIDAQVAKGGDLSASDYVISAA